MITLIFPDTESMAEFVIQHEVNNVEVDSVTITLTGELSVPQLEVACEQFAAYQLPSLEHLDD